VAHVQGPPAGPRSLQFIGPDGDQRFLTGGRAAGCYFGIGRVKDAAKPCIAEGFATGESVHEATGYPVAVAFNAGNLLATAQAMGATARSGCRDASRRGGSAPARAGYESASAADSASGAWLRPVARQHPEPEPRCYPLPIPSALLPVEPLDVALLPQARRERVADIADWMQCPPDFPAVGAMVALSSVIGRKACLCPKRHDDWLVVPNLWGAIVGRLGVMKSPALAEVLKPLGKAGKKPDFRDDGGAADGTAC